MLAFVFAVLAAAGAQKLDDPHGALRLQLLLDRARCSPGEIDARPGENTRRALVVFQKRSGLRATGRADAATWRALDAESPAPPTLTAYTLSDADVAGPFAPVPEDMMEKAKLPALGYASLQEALGERFHASPALIERLNPHARFTPGEKLRVPNVRVEPLAGHAARVVVDAVSSSVSALDGEGHLLAYYPASMGSEHDPLPVGEWKIVGVSQNPPFFYNPDLFWDADETHAKARIAPGPNNPIGTVWIDLSKPHYGIHGTPEPSSIGKTQSHGCIRLTNWDAEELSHLVKPGTPALLQRGAK